MPRIDIAAKCSLETLVASGLRNSDRLFALCEHFGCSYGFTAEKTYARALELKPQWLVLA